MKLIYKDKEYSLAELREEQRVFSEDLKLPDYFRKVSNPDLLGFDYGYCLAFEFLSDVYSQVASARYALLLGHKKLHDSNHISWSSGETGQYWLRYEYLKNSIIWYNASYEMLWQALWFSYFLFRNLKFTIKNKRDIKFHDVDSKVTYQILLSQCNYNRLKESLSKISTDDSRTLLRIIDKFHCSEQQKIVREWANKLKHRGNLKAKEIYYSDGVQLTAGKYDSSYTDPEVISIDEIIDTLREYHINFLKLTENVYSFLDYKKITEGGEYGLILDVKEYKKIIIE